MPNQSMHQLARTQFNIFLLRAACAVLTKGFNALLVQLVSQEKLLYSATDAHWLAGNLRRGCI